MCENFPDGGLIMAKLISITSTPAISNAEIKQMLSWLASIAADERESAAVRKHACAASLLMAELFDIGDDTNERLGGLFVGFKNSGHRPRSA
jgi:hypothetical protein